MGVDVSSSLIYGWDVEDGFCDWFYEEAFPYTKYYVKNGLAEMTEDERQEHWDKWHENRYEYFHHVNLYEDWGQAFGVFVGVPSNCSIARMSDGLAKAKAELEKVLRDMFISGFDYKVHFGLVEPGANLLTFFW